MKQAFVLVVCSFFLNYCVKPGELHSCRTPNAEDGRCISIYDCKILKDALMTGNNVDFLKASQCGWVGVLNPKVCCGSDAGDTGRDKFPDLKTLLPKSDTCGFQEISDKITNGDSTLITEFPWSALLVYDKKNGKTYNCGGVLIGSRYVLTAAHCYSPDLRWVRFGEHNLRSQPDCQLTTCSMSFDVEVETFLEHTFYNKESKSYFDDIALIRLKHSINFTQFVQPICLPRSSSDRSDIGSKLWFAGWGATSTNDLEENSSIKQKVLLSVISLDECKNKYYLMKWDINLNDSRICTGGEENKINCQGDSGGGLVAYFKDKLIQSYVEGILSYSSVRCNSKHPGVFTRVSDFLPWINNNIH